ncbi:MULTISPECIES: ABC transporter ATP-binding protein [Dyella]|uniref:ABC transporter ATP-binding protein n=2 Tax=Dyella TaxID=231454 RepID=A0A4R0YZD4_9GAMM|nr:MULTISPECIES: ABC transporter ATP-binding protein [Dyella]TBR40242.1 ABC transporter ATP-binding protein [Dyella terrae]TCI12176.1 ABC transporter ATP-binding protein [Dyella soli]
MSDFVIETCELTKRYGDKLALNRLSLQIPRGRIHAIVGANGAGKSTLFRILLGFLSPTEGRSRLLGQDSHSLTPGHRARIGFVNEEHTLPGWMRADEVTDMQRRQYPRWNEDMYRDVLGHYHVGPRQKISQLSRGERAGLNLALALAQSPELLILDEPTLGLDVVAKRAFLQSLLDSNAAEHCTVIYCSHQMEEIERLADNLIILERGELKHMSPPDEFCERVRHWVADIPFRGPERAQIPGLLLAQKIDNLYHYTVLDQDDDFAAFLRENGARHVQSMPVSLDSAVNGFLAKDHAAPLAREARHG